MKLALVLGRAADLPLARSLTAAALRAGDEVRWFAMADGVAALAARLADERAAEADGFDESFDEAPPFEIIACATSVDQRGLALPAAIVLGSQDDHAALLAWADRTVALT
jgi:DsrE/DsrF-like family